MRYFQKRHTLFRLDPQTLMGARWGKDTRRWIDIGSYVAQQTVYGADPTFVEITSVQVKKVLPEALSGDQVAQPAPSDPAADYAALTVSQMSNIIGSVSSKGTFDTWLPTSGVSALDAPVARKFWDEMVRENDALKPGQTLAPPSEWS